MNRIKTLFASHGAWLLLAVPVVVIALCFAASAAKPEPRTIAEPPAEREITFDMEKNRAYTADDGIIVIGDASTPTAEMMEKSASAMPAAANTDAGIAAQSAAASVKASGAYTLPEDAQLEDGSIGVLSIPKLKLSVSVFETDDEMEAMTHGLAHFKTTSAWDGNIGLCGHNVNFDLTDGYFKNIHTLSEGDTITYKTALGSRNYTVVTVAEIAASDWSYLGRTEDDRITLITCISGKPNSRLVVQATAN
ncbi:class D sortase [Ruminococcaceae bacterium OttesenSCG-928-L11]|nr:class D sortase [Ruminococcaceae bacterium OttesenSCG-928-L11]